jgi:hypothetical protein
MADPEWRCIPAAAREPWRPPGGRPPARAPGDVGAAVAQRPDVVERALALVHLRPEIELGLARLLGKVGAGAQVGRLGGLEQQLDVREADGAVALLVHRLQGRELLVVEAGLDAGEVRVRRDFLRGPVVVGREDLPAPARAADRSPKPLPPTSTTDSTPPACGSPLASTATPASRFSKAAPSSRSSENQSRSPMLDVNGLLAPRRIALAWHRERQPSPAARAFMELARSVCGPLGAASAA